MNNILSQDFKTVVIESGKLLILTITHKWYQNKKGFKSQRALRAVVWINLRNAPLLIRE